MMPWPRRCDACNTILTQEEDEYCGGCIEHNDDEQELWSHSHDDESETDDLRYSDQL